MTLTATCRSGTISSPRTAAVLSVSGSVDVFNIDVLAGTLVRYSELIGGHFEPLTTRETEVLILMSDGMPSRQIAARLGISYATVRSHIRSVGAKLGAHSKHEAILRARQLALIS